MVSFLKKHPERCNPYELKNDKNLSNLKSLSSKKPRSSGLGEGSYGLTEKRKLGDFLNGKQKLTARMTETGDKFF